MTEETEGRHPKRKRLWLALAALAALLAVLIVPPLVSIARYKSGITRLISASLRRPVRLSSVEARLLPRPGFILTNLIVEEDPAYGTEPVLHANTVRASIRLLSLWRGRLEIDTISVDEASLNLVRTPSGRWNLDSFLNTAHEQAQSATGHASAPRAVRTPYLEATNSRINIKSGAEKLPFSLVDADLSISQPSPGQWRLRLKGQPARTDLSLDLADTGVVRLDATLRQSPELRLMPVHLDLVWREAQLGQLTRLLLGSDAGWRGDLTAELHLEGTSESAQLTTRLRATGVHRAEFAPLAPMDFDANCNMVSHYAARTVENLECDSPLGNGRIRLTGKLLGEVVRPQFSIELDHIPVAAGLDALRTVRSRLASGLQAAGTATGKLTYAPLPPAAEAPAKPSHPTLAKARSPKVHEAAPGPLTGSLVVEGFQLSGDGLTEEIRIPRIVLEPAPASADEDSSFQPQALTASVALPSGGAAPLTLSTHITLSGYRLSVRGQASIRRARELARVAGIAEVAVLDAFAGDPLSLDLTAEGPWMPPLDSHFVETVSSPETPASAVAQPAPADSLSGTLSLHNTNWRADYLASPATISQATLHLGPKELRWDPVVFSYGPVKGTASLRVPAHCDSTKPCLPIFQLQFGTLDAAVLQTAFLGAREKGTLLSTLIARLRPSAPAPAWPQMDGTVKVESFILGPVTLRRASASAHILRDGAEITGLEADMLGGRLHGRGTLHLPQSPQDKPAYTFEGLLTKLNPAAVGQLAGQRWSGAGFDAEGRVALSGYTQEDLAASAKGAMHFDWRRGVVAGGASTGPAILSRFDRWTADAEIADGVIALKDNQVQRGAQHAAVEATVTLGASQKVIFALPGQSSGKR